MKPVVMPFKPHPHQREAHCSRKRWTVLVWPRRAGKTVWAVVELILAAASCPLPRGRYGYIAPFYRQAKDVAWGYLKTYAGAIPGVVFNESELTCTLPNGAVIRLYGADNPDSLRGLYFDGVVMDEPADQRPQVWGEVVRPALTDRKGWAIWIGTPKGINQFSDTYFKALVDPEWFADLKRWDELAIYDPAEVESARRGMSESQFAQEFTCDFHAAVDNALIPLDHVMEAQRRDVSEGEVYYDPKIIGVDVARSPKGDRSAMAKRQGKVCFPIRAWRGLDTMELVAQVAHEADEWQPDAIFVDIGGVGRGVYDRLRQLGYRVLEVDFGSKAIDERFENLRAEMWWKMGEWMRDACLPSDQELVQELVAPTFSHANARGRFCLESKDDMKKRGLKSPDKADALCVTFAQPIARKATTALEAALNRKRSTAVDYDPFHRSEEAR